MKHIPYLFGQRGGFYVVGGGGGGGGGRVLTSLGSRFNDYVRNKTTGAGGDYPDGDIWMGAGTYYCDPFDMDFGGYARSFDASKPYNNWLRIREYDGPGTVILDLRPESAASALGQTTTQAYNDFNGTSLVANHGGAFQNIAGTNGSFRWCFDGGIKFQNGAIYLTAQRGVNVSISSGSNQINAASGTFTSADAGRTITTDYNFGAGHYPIPASTITTYVNSTRVLIDNTATENNSGVFSRIHNPGCDRLIFHRTYHTDPITEWRRQFDIIRVIKGYPDPGPYIPDDSGGADIYHGGVFFSAQYKGNFSPSAFRLEGGSRIAVLGATMGHLGDDGIFTGSGCDRIIEVGTVAFAVDSGDGGYQGQGPVNWLHNDCWQFTGSLTNCASYDCTHQGHGAEWIAESGEVQNFIVDRMWQGMAGSGGGDIGTSGGWSIDSASKIGSGGPTTRTAAAYTARGLPQHFYRVFSNGTSFRDHDPQLGYATNGAGASWHTGLILFDGSSPTRMHASVSVNVAVPNGVTVDSDGFVTSGLDSFLNSADAPHNIFRSMYTESELLAVMADYGIAFD